MKVDLFPHTKRAPKGRTVSFSELNTLSQCEAMWFYAWEAQQPDPSGAAAYLGSIMHALCRAFWEGREWRIEFTEMYGTQFFDAVPITMPEPWITAEWLMTRYEAHYNENARTAVKVQHEVALSAKLPNGTKVTSHLDGLYEIGGETWILERKTMGDWSRLDLLAVDPQLTLYYWLCQENGIDVAGIAFDAIRTYRWKRDEHPPADSFEWVWLDRTQAHVDAALKQAVSGVQRRAALRRPGAVPIRSLGKHCGWCSFRDECWGDLAFPQPEITIED